MAKVYGLTGKANGKFGNAVFRIRYGQQVMSQYNPVVANPRTQAQVDVRSKLKLVSQLSAVLAQVIAMPRIGAITARNRFTKVNYQAAGVSDGLARIDLPVVQLTDSARRMPAFTVTRDSGNSIDASLLEASPFSRVVYVVVAKDIKGLLRVFDSAVVNNSAPGVANTFPAKMNYTSEAIVVYAYGITDLNEKASATFGNINSPTAESIARVIANRVLNYNDAVTTATNGAYLEVGTTNAQGVQTGGSAGQDTQTSVVDMPTIGGQSPFVEYTDLILSAQAGATIYYTLDGAIPTTASPVYSAPIRISATTTVMAMAVVDGVQSAVNMRTLSKNANDSVMVLAPTITKSGGGTIFYNSADVFITAEEGATIYYTTDGSEPTTESTEYENNFLIRATTTVKAIAVLQGQSSAVTTAVFTLDQSYGDTN